MAKPHKKARALHLRRAGKSYSEIKSIIKVSKSTLSRWLKDYPLSQKQLMALRDWNQKRIENYRETRKRHREALLAKIYAREKKVLLPLTKRDLLISGLFLYWGEGTKTKVAEASISNTNPAVVKAFIYWLKRGFGINRSKLVVKLHLYSDMNIKQEISYWSKTLSIPLTQFNKPYIKKSRFSSLSYKNGFGHGTCNVTVRNATLSKKILMGLRVLEDFFMGQ
ncbi:MAG: helix-turn-helix domain-containing protein [Parcubacteria group bacterium]|nr:helix-turn-helix domain-containing protein [Parcubacteria group bacterium]